MQYLLFALPLFVVIWVGSILFRDWLRQYYPGQRHQRKEKTEMTNKNEYYNDITQEVCKTPFPIQEEPPVSSGPSMTWYKVFRVYIIIQAVIGPLSAIGQYSYYSNQYASLGLPVSEYWNSPFTVLSIIETVIGCLLFIALAYCLITYDYHSKHFCIALFSKSLIFSLAGLLLCNGYGLDWSPYFGNLIAFTIIYIPSAIYLSKREDYLKARKTGDALNTIAYAEQVCSNNNVSVPAECSPIEPLEQTPPPQPAIIQPKAQDIVSSSPARVIAHKTGNRPSIVVKKGTPEPAASSPVERVIPKKKNRPVIVLSSLCGLLAIASIILGVQNYQQKTELIRLNETKQENFVLTSKYNAALDILKYHFSSRNWDELITDIAAWENEGQPGFNLSYALARTPKAADNKNNIPSLEEVIAHRNQVWGGKEPNSITFTGP